jgi:hypothetical protein
MHATFGSHAETLSLYKVALRLDPRLASDLNRLAVGHLQCMSMNAGAALFDLVTRAEVAGLMPVGPVRVDRDGRAADLIYRAAEARLAFPGMLGKGTLLTGPLPPVDNRFIASEGVRLIAAQDPGIRRLATSLTQAPLFRGLTTTDGYVEKCVQEGDTQWRTANVEHGPMYQALDRGNTLEALRRISTEGKAFMPLLWGFRVYERGDPLFAREENTIAAFRDMMAGLPADVDAPLILCDRHADHNHVPASYYEPYYDQVEAVAARLGVPTIRLSAIYDELGISLGDVEEQGKALVQKAGKPHELDPNVPVTLPGDYWGQLKIQAKHTVGRFPGVFDDAIPEGGKKVKERFFSDKAQHYAQFRASEGVHVLTRLGELDRVNGGPVLPVHIASPDSGLVGVCGVYINACDDNNQIAVAIPWGGQVKPPCSN